jgi:hypothetical protein
VKEEMRGVDISAFITNELPLLSPHFSGVLGLNEARGFLLQPSRSFAIVNTDVTPDTGGTGGVHWFTLMRMDEGDLELFDSLGIQSRDVIFRLGELLDAEYNVSAVQGPSSSLCGEFCLYFSYARFLNADWSLADCIDTFFTQNFDTNAAIVENFISTRGDLYDPPLIL